MAKITLKGNTIHTNGSLPKIGKKAPDFVLVDKDLKNVSLKDLKGIKILSTIPSLDTAVCATSAKKFNAKIANFPNVTLLVISFDLPFAQKRFCESANAHNIQTLSIMRSKDFAKDYGLLIQDGPLEGICARSLIILDQDNKVLYTELVPEITQEPNYAIDSYLK